MLDWLAATVGRVPLPSAVGGVARAQAAQGLPAACVPGAAHAGAPGRVPARLAGDEDGCQPHHTHLSAGASSTSHHALPRQQVSL